MSKIKKFLDNYDTILFDMDGVVTSERAYWTSAAMTVYEMLVSSKYYGDRRLRSADIYEHREQISHEVFNGDKTICVLKDKGVNSNWDLAYVVLSETLLGDTNNFSSVYEKVCGYCGDIFYEYEMLAKRLSEKFNESVSYFERGGDFWCRVQLLFQRWYLGDGSVPGLICEEKPIFGAERTHRVMSALVESGKTIGIGTGRPRYEIETPLANWKLLELFDKKRIITYDDVEAGEREMAALGEQIAFTKPHPFMFLKGALTSAYPTKRIADGDYDRDVLKKTLVVGDAGADILAAQAGGMDFMAVLTGVSGIKAKAYFESQKATYILGSICDMTE